MWIRDPPVRILPLEEPLGVMGSLFAKCLVLVRWCLAYFRGLEECRDLRSREVLGFGIRVGSF